MEVSFSFQSVNDMTQYVYIQLPFLILIFFRNFKINFFSIGCLPLVKKVSCLQHSAIQNIRKPILKQTVDQRDRTKDITENFVQREVLFLPIIVPLIYHLLE